MIEKTNIKNFFFSGINEILCLSISIFSSLLIILLRSGFNIHLEILVNSLILIFFLIFSPLVFSNQLNKSESSLYSKPSILFFCLCVVFFLGWIKENFNFNLFFIIYFFNLYYLYYLLKKK